MLARKIHHLRHLGLGDLVGEDAALADPVMMDVEHDLGGGFDVLLKELFQDVDHELHRRVIVVENQDAVQVGSLGLRLDLGDDGGSRPARTGRAVFVLPILGRTAAIGAGTCGSKIEVSCGMAQAFDIPMGNRTAANGSSQAGAVMASIFRSPSPAEATRPDLTGGEYGSVPGPMQAGPMHRNGSDS